MPTLDDLYTVYKLLPETSDPEYEAKKALKEWYYDEYLPMVAGNNTYGKSIRYYSTPVDKVTLVVKGVKGKKRVVAVTIPSEAFGLLIFENCRDKWLAVMNLRKDDKKKEIPDFDKEDASTHKYHITKWSDGKTGQVTGGGWKAAAFTKFNQLMVAIDKIRKEDKANGWEEMKEAKAIIRAKNSITAPVKSNKRRRNNNPTIEPEDYEELVEFSDSDTEIEA